MDVVDSFARNTIKYFSVQLNYFCVSFVTCQLVDGIFSNLVSELYLVVPVQLKL